MAEFDDSVADMILKHEGGYVCDPDDPGGETNFGISRHTYPTLDIKNLTRERARAIYKRDWWDPGPYSRIKNQAVAAKYFDLAVNVGERQATLMLQRACGDAGHPTVADGKCGSITLASVNACDPDTLVDKLRARARTYYLELVERRPSSEKFLKGWLARADA